LLVMVVDDSVTVRKVTSRLLERHGMSVLTAKDGVDAMALLEEHRPTCCCWTSRCRAWTASRWPRASAVTQRLKELPIIMITSRTGQKHRERAMAIGVNEYLGKPYQESVLLQSIAHWSQPMLEHIAGQRSSLTGLLLPLGDRPGAANVAVAELIGQRNLVCQPGEPLAPGLDRLAPATLAADRFRGRVRWADAVR
jgi:CheY-like chemotaxis protein